ncbi:AraC-like DNA-binding protein [Clavibacter michiganensis]|nr:AraC-like DNA-binding protein [Clavibacter michiganensis]
MYSTDPAQTPPGPTTTGPSLFTSSTGTSMPAGTSRTEHRTEHAGACTGEADDVYRAAYGGDLATSAGDSPFSYRYASVGNDRVSLRTSELSGRIRGEVPNLTDYVVGWFRTGSGSLQLRDHQRAGTVEAPFLLPTERAFRLDFRPHRQNLIHLGPAFLEDIATERHGGPARHVSFDHHSDANPWALAAWREAVSVLTRAVVRVSVTPLMRFAAEMSLARVLLRLFPWKAWAVPAELRLPQAARVREALDYLHHHAHEPITPADAARAAGMHTRSLQLATARHLGMTPSAYLRDIRLQRVHDQLRAAAPRSITVKDAARTWGFGNLGRFAAGYAAHFDEKPSDTLRRAP